MKVRTRFAPSPTGFLHVGGVRTALFNYLLAKQSGGSFILRLEDTDRERFVAEGVEQIVEALDWLGLKPDEGFWIESLPQTSSSDQKERLEADSEGKHQSIEYVQSERHKTGIYQKLADKLVEKGVAYRDWSTPKELDEWREKARKDKKPFLFRKEMAKLDGSKDKPHVIRFEVSAASKNNEVSWQETVRGDMSIPTASIDDFIIIKSDGFPTYNFANVVDDHDMDITHVLRGDEFISSTPKHLLLYHALDFRPPEFIHLPVINGDDGKKLSKRTGDTDVLNYREKGYMPEALLNFLALLGWNDGTEQEIFNLDELKKKFSLEHVNASPAVFDQRRLDWISGHHIRETQIDKLFELTKNYWPDEAKEHSSSYKLQVLKLVQERLKYFAELPDLTRFFFTDLPVNPELISNHKQLKKLGKEDLVTYLNGTKKELEQSDFTVEDLTKRLNGLLYLTHTKPVILFSLIRIATTQAPASPGLAETLAVLGRETALRRLQQQLDVLE